MFVEIIYQGSGGLIVYVLKGGDEVFCIGF